MLQIFQYGHYLSSLFIGLLGVGLFYWLHLPMPWLLGSIFSVLLAAHFLKLNVIKPAKLANPVRIILGVSVGSAFSPALLNEASSYLFSLLFVVLAVAMFVFIGYAYYTKIAGLDKKTAYFSALPGGMLEMVAICESYGGDVRRVMLIQTTRITLIVYTVPFIIQHWGGIDLTGRTRIAQELSVIPIDQALMMGLVGFLGWYIMSRTRLAGAAIIGPMMLSAIVYSSGLLEARVPDELIYFAQLVLGAGVGTSFIGVKKREVFQSLLAALGFFIILMLVSILVAVLMSHLTGIPFVATLIAFIPGGQAEMNVMALIVGISIPYIALHHLLRMFLVMSIAPLLASFFTK